MVASGSWLWKMVRASSKTSYYYHLIIMDNVRILAHFRIPALMEKDMGRAGYDFQSPDNEKPRLERGTEPCPRKSYSSTRPCSRASSTPWCARRSSGSSTRCPTLQADEIANAARYERFGGRKAYRSGHYERSLTAKAGRLELKVPKSKGALFDHRGLEDRALELGYPEFELACFFAAGLRS